MVKTTEVALGLLSDELAEGLGLGRATLMCGKVTVHTHGQGLTL